MKKRIITVLLCAVMSIGLCSCGLFTPVQVGSNSSESEEEEIKAEEKRQKKDIELLEAVKTVVEVYVADQFATGCKLEDIYIEIDGDNKEIVVSGGCANHSVENACDEVIVERKLRSDGWANVTIYYELETFTWQGVDELKERNHNQPGKRLSDAFK